MLHVVVAVCGNLPHVKELLRTLELAAQTVPMRIVVCDNGSKDGSTEYFLSRSSELTLFPFDRNMGCAVAWNTGIRFSFQNNADAILVCGSDTAPLPGTVERLYSGIQSGMAFITGTQCGYDSDPEAPTPGNDLTPLLAAPDFSFFMFNPRAVIERVGSFDVHVEHKSKVQFHAQAGEKAPYTMRMNPWDNGLFDTGFMLGYYEDNDFHLRAHSAGVPCLRDQTALFRHDCSLTIRTNPEIAKQNQHTFPANAARFVRKWSKLPHELDILGARPLNVSDIEWATMTGGKEVQELDRKKVIEDARRVYGAHGVKG